MSRVKKKVVGVIHPISLFFLIINSARLGLFRWGSFGFLSSARWVERERKKDLMDGDSVFYKVKCVCIYITQFLLFFLFCCLGYLSSKYDLVSLFLLFMLFFFVVVRKLRVFCELDSHEQREFSRFFPFPLKKVSAPIFHQNPLLFFYQQFDFFFF